MIRFHRLSFRRGEARIELDIGLDESAALDGAVIAFEVTATLHEPGRHPYTQTMTVEIDIATNRGVVKWNDADIYKFDLSQLPTLLDGEEERIPDVDAGEADAIGEAVEKGMGEKIGEMIDAMPVPEPFFGCALKAGISSVIGQTLACNEKAGGPGGPRQRARRIFKCLLKNSGGILWKTAWRYALCVARLGG